MSIHLKCNSPKYARGELEFTTFEELFHWLKTIAGLAKATPSYWLYGLVKDGRFNGATARFMIEIISDHRDYFLARELAFQTGLLKARGFGEVITQSNEAALAFAQALDSRLLSFSTPQYA
jgi:hypothetical protein